MHLKQTIRKRSVYRLAVVKSRSDRFIDLWMFNDNKTHFYRFSLKVSCKCQRRRGRTSRNSCFATLLQSLRTSVWIPRLIGRTQLRWSRARWGTFTSPSTLAKTPSSRSHRFWLSIDLLINFSSLFKSLPACFFAVYLKQALEIIKQLKESNSIKLQRAQMRLKVTVPGTNFDV